MEKRRGARIQNTINLQIVVQPLLTLTHHWGLSANRDDGGMLKTVHADQFTVR
jgi:hypothetical protein